MVRRTKILNREDIIMTSRKRTASKLRLVGETFNSKIDLNEYFRKKLIILLSEQKKLK